MRCILTTLAVVAALLFSAGSAWAEEINDDLGWRLELALASNGEELAEYRSEIMGRLREKEVVTYTAMTRDRFISQSRLLFSSGAADLSTPGKEGLRSFASVLKSDEALPD